MNRDALVQLNEKGVILKFPPAFSSTHTALVFHSFRHSSITYKLKLNGGDMKSVQEKAGDTVTEGITSQAADSDQKLLLKLLANSEMAALLKSLA